MLNAPDRCFVITAEKELHNYGMIIRNDPGMINVRTLKIQRGGRRYFKRERCVKGGRGKKSMTPFVTAHEEIIARFADENDEV